MSAVEGPRAELHTLNENHDIFLSTSFDTPMNDGSFGVGIGPSSSQFGGGFGLGDNFFDNADVGADIGDELAQELGEGWGGPPDAQRAG